MRPSEPESTRTQHHGFNICSKFNISLDAHETWVVMVVMVDESINLKKGCICFTIIEKDARMEVVDCGEGMVRGVVRGR